MTSPLPRRIRYLSEFIAQLESIDPEEIDEDTDTSKLQVAVSTRLSGLRPSAARTRLAQDQAALKRWLEGRPDHPGYFVVGFLDPGNAELYQDFEEPDSSLSSGAWSERVPTAHLGTATIQGVSAERSGRGILFLSQDWIVEATPISSAEWDYDARLSKAMKLSPSKVEIGDYDGWAYEHEGRNVYLLRSGQIHLQLGVVRLASEPDPEALKSLLSLLVFHS